MWVVVVRGRDIGQAMVQMLLPEANDMHCKHTAYARPCSCMRREMVHAVGYAAQTSEARSRALHLL